MCLLRLECAILAVATFILKPAKLQQTCCPSLRAIRTSAGNHFPDPERHQRREATHILQLLPTVYHSLRKENAVVDYTTASRCEFTLVRFWERDHCKRVGFDRDNCCVHEQGSLLQGFVQEAAGPVERGVACIQETGHRRSASRHDRDRSAAKHHEDCHVSCISQAICESATQVSTSLPVIQAP